MHVQADDGCIIVACSVPRRKSQPSTVYLSFRYMYLGSDEPTPFSVAAPSTITITCLKCSLDVQVGTYVLMYIRIRSTQVPSFRGPTIPSIIGIKSDIYLSTYSYEASFHTYSMCAVLIRILCSLQHGFQNGQEPTGTHATCLPTCCHLLRLVRVRQLVSEELQSNPHTYLYMYIPT